MMKPFCDRLLAKNINPLIGNSTVDTIHNLCICLDKMGVTIASQNQDDSIFFFCSSVSAALKYEAGALRNQGKAAAPRKSHSVRLANRG